MVTDRGSCYETCGDAFPSAALVYVNTLMLQDVLAEGDWADLLTPEDPRGLTPLFWQHMLSYGEVKLDMTTRLSVRTTVSSSDRSGSAQ